jgi:hypothetical protein
VHLPDAKGPRLSRDFLGILGSQKSFQRLSRNFGIPEKFLGRISRILTHRASSRILNVHLKCMHLKDGHRASSERKGSKTFLGILGSQKSFQRLSRNFGIPEKFLGRISRILSHRASSKDPERASEFRDGIDLYEKPKGSRVKENGVAGRETHLGNQ